jgi:flagellar biosynthetic protein FliP
MRQTRQSDIVMIAELRGDKGYENAEALPFTVAVPAFILSELRTAFTIGFLLYLPFLVIDIVVASVLMSLGMMMLSPMLVSMPFKLLLFVIVDGWALTVSSLVESFQQGL